MSIANGLDASPPNRPTHEDRQSRCLPLLHPRMPSMQLRTNVVDLFYDGSCKDLNPGPTAVVKEFKFDEKGTLSIQMMIPKSCAANAKTINKWQLYIFERRLPVYPKELAGIRPVFW